MSLVLYILYIRYWCFKGDPLGLLDITYEVVKYLVGKIFNVIHFQYTPMHTNSC